MTKGINRRSFHRIPGKPDTPRTPFTVCSTIITLSDRHLFHFCPGIGPSPSPPIFTVPFSMFPPIPRCFFVFFFAVRQKLPPLCFSSHFPCSFLSSCFWRTPSQTARRRRCRRDQSIAASRDKRVRPYRCRFAAFSRSIIPAGCREVWRETTVYTMTVNDVLGNVSLS